MLHYKHSVWVFTEKVLWPRKLEKNLDETKLPVSLYCRTYQHLSWESFTVTVNLSEGV